MWFKFNIYKQTISVVLSKFYVAVIFRLNILVFYAWKLELLSVFISLIVLHFHKMFYSS